MNHPAMKPSGSSRTGSVSDDLMSRREIGLVLGLSGERVRKLELQALAKLRARAGRFGLHPGFLDRGPDMPGDPRIPDTPASELSLIQAAEEDDDA